MVTTDEADASLARQRRASGRSNDDISSDIRSEFARDVDRFVYNYYWQRLAEITQVYSTGTLESTAWAKKPQHNRMTHSQKVAQVGKRLTQYLLANKANAINISAAGGLDVDVVEAACLAHDLGHPPYGHRGEQELDRLARFHGLEDGFEGNAQTFRILTSLSQHGEIHASRVGMDLTAATLAATSKYPWPRDREATADGFAAAAWHKFGYYDADAATFKRLVTPLLPSGKTPTLEAQLMDWADDVSYAVHDVEDFYKAGLIPLDRLRHRDASSKGSPAQYEAANDTEVNQFLLYLSHRLGGRTENTSPDQARALFAEYACYFPERPYEGRRLQDGIVETFASKVITDSSRAATVDQNGNLYVSPSIRRLVAILKQLTVHYVIERPDLVTHQAGHILKLRAVFEHIFARAMDALADEVQDPLTGKVVHVSRPEQWQRRRTLPVRLDELLEDTEDIFPPAQPGNAVARAVVDYVASMTEREVDHYFATVGPGPTATRAG